MRRVSNSLVVVCFAGALAGCVGGADMESLNGRASYAIGLDIGSSLRGTNVEMDLDALMAGIRDILEENEPLLNPEEVAQVMQEFNEEMTRAAAELAAKNLEEGLAFLEDNASEDGVMTTESGLQYMVLTEGDGAMPTRADTATVHYKGTLIDGTEFDSSADRGPATFPVGGVIPGWTEALQLMKVGGKLRLFIPSALAYGPSGSGPVIPPNSVLIFEVELLGINGQ